MSDRPDAAEMAAIAAAYAIVMRARETAAAAIAPPAWRLAARIELATAPDARAAARRTPWRASTAP